MASKYITYINTYTLFLVTQVEITETGVISLGADDDVNSTSEESYSTSPVTTPRPSSPISPLWLEDDYEPDGSFSSASTSPRADNSYSNDYQAFEDTIFSFAFDDIPLDQSFTTGLSHNNEGEIATTKSNTA